MSTQHLPPAVQITDLATQHWRVQCLYAATKLDLAQALHGGAKTVAALAQEVGADQMVLRRLLRALASTGVFTETEDGVFANTPLSDVLRADHPQSARAVVLMSDGPMLWHAWSKLVDGVETGRVPFEIAYGEPLFDYQKKYPEEEQIYAAAMTSLSESQNAIIAEIYPFSEISTVVDVGGSNGHLLATLVRKHTHLTGILFDLPTVVDSARSKGYIAAPDVKARIRAEPGSALETAPKCADAYILKTVIHDWLDEPSLAMLRNCRDAMNANGRILLIEHIVKPRNEPDFMKFVDMAMFVLHNGLERTEAEWRDLCARAGLQISRKLPTGVGPTIMELVRA